MSPGHTSTRLFLFTEGLTKKARLDLFLNYSATKNDFEYTDWANALALFQMILDDHGVTVECTCELYRLKRIVGTLTHSCASSACISRTERENGEQKRVGGRIVDGVDLQWISQFTQNTVADRN